MIGDILFNKGMCVVDPHHYLPPNKRRSKILYQDPKTAKPCMDFDSGGIWLFVRDYIWDW